MPSSLDFEALLDASPNSYMVLDRSLRFVWANAAYLRVTSSRLEDLAGRHILEAFPNDPIDVNNESARQLVESLERTLTTGEVDVLAFIRYRVPKAGGVATPDADRYWSATHTPIFDERGEVAYVLQHTVDVTELRTLQQELPYSGAAETGGGQTEAGVLHRARIVQQANLSLDEERRHLRRLFEQAPGFTCFLRGPEHVVEIANDAYYTLVGHREIIGRPIREALPEVAGQGFFELLDTVFSSGVPFVGRGMRAMLQRDPDGELDERFIDLVYQPILETDGRVSGIFVQGHDITEMKRLESQLERLLMRERAARADAEVARAEAERANRLKDEFLATVSHELRTPLNALLGWVRLLRTRQVNDELRARALDVIERNATLQAQLVEDILDVSRIVTGKLSLNVRSTELGQVVEAGVEIVRPAADAKGVVLERMPSPAVTFEGDPDRLQQVVWNLLSNAVKFTPAGGTVRVRLARIGETIALTVTDSGEGIAADLLPHVFERFRQGDAGVDRAHGGLGLGLAVVKHLVEAHGGSVEAFSDGPGSGATFTVQLPAAVPRRAGEQETVSRA